MRRNDELKNDYESTYEMISNYELKRIMRCHFYGETSTNPILGEQYSNKMPTSGGILCRIFDHEWIE